MTITLKLNSVSDSLRQGYKSGRVHPSRMDANSNREHSNILGHVLVPIADEDGARRTARGLAPYASDPVTTPCVLEKGEGMPDKTPVERSEQAAKEALAAVQETLSSGENYTTYSRDIVEAISDTVAGVEASAIAYRSRGGGRLMQFLSGDLSLRLATQAASPVITLPRKGVEI